MIMIIKENILTAAKGGKQTLLQKNKDKSYISPQKVYKPENTGEIALNCCKYKITKIQLGMMVQAL